VSVSVCGGAWSGREGIAVRGDDGKASVEFCCSGAKDSRARFDFDVGAAVRVYML
jgi:hypothetical protein